LDCFYPNIGRIVKLISNTKDLNKLANTSNFISQCIDKTNKDILVNTLIENAKKGDFGAQVILADTYSMKTETKYSLKAIKWSQILSENDIDFFKNHLKKSFEKVINSNNIVIAKDYLDHAKNMSMRLKIKKSLDKEFHSESHFIIEYFLNEAEKKSKLEKDHTTQASAYMRLGNLNLYHHEKDFNKEFGQYGFSLKKAKSYYEKALKTSKAHNNITGELNAYLALAIYHNSKYFDNKEMACKYAVKASNLYENNKEKIQVKDKYRPKEKFRIKQSSNIIIDKSSYATKLAQRIKKETNCI